MLLQIVSVEDRGGDCWLQVIYTIVIHYNKISHLPALRLHGVLNLAGSSHLVCLFLFFSFLLHCRWAGDFYILSTFHYMFIDNRFHGCITFYTQPVSTMLLLVLGPAMTFPMQSVINYVDFSNYSRVALYLLFLYSVSLPICNSFIFTLPNRMLCMFWHYSNKWGYFFLISLRYSYNELKI